MNEHLSEQDELSEEQLRTNRDFYDREVAKVLEEGGLGTGPGGVLEDGFGAIITLTGAGTSFLEIDTQPPGYDGEEAINTTTHRNTLYRTKAARQLITVTDGAITAAYATSYLATALTQINLNQSIVWTYPDGTTKTVWGFLQSCIPDSMKEGQLPTVKLKIVATNRNASGVETGPV